MELYYKVLARIAQLANREDGQTMTEYALLVALIALLLIAAIGVLTGGISHIFSGTGQHLSGIAT
jgi:pilus assembly protein Flp/PilA